MAFDPRHLRFSFTCKNITHYSGLFLLQHLFQRLKQRQSLIWSVRFAERNNRYTTSKLIAALRYPLQVGSGRIDASGILKRNGVFRYLTDLTSSPDATTRRFLLRFSGEALASFMHFYDTLQTRMNATAGKVIFDRDTTLLTVCGRQERAAFGYNAKMRGRCRALGAAKLTAHLQPQRAF